MDSRADVNTSYGYFDEGPRPSTSRPGSGFGVSNGVAHNQSPSNEPYSPGLRSMAARNASQNDVIEEQSPGDVQMQSFEDGLAPPPPPLHSWKRIDAWAEDNYPELFDQLGEGATVNDLNDLEHQLDCSLPQDVRESLMIHDGQERGGMPTGIIFGSMLMDCEEIVQEWDQWRRVNHQFLMETTVESPSLPSKAFGGTAEASSSRQEVSPSPSSGEWRQDLLAKQDCIPPKAIQKTYAHSGWIPLVRDWGGNNLAVDLAPGPGGRWGQIILFGRDYDTKYVISRSWSAFLAVVADDLNSGKWYVDEETSELRLREFKDTRVEPSYFSILRWRVDQKYGRRGGARRKSMAKQGSPRGSRSGSPYSSTNEVNGDGRGRSLQRINGSPLASPRLAFSKASPLSRVTEETILPELAGANIQPSKLVEVATPNDDIPKAPRVSTLARSESDLLKDKENEMPKINEDEAKISDGTMREIEI